MLGISTLCLHHEPLPLALDKIAKVTGSIEVMDEGLHFLNGAEQSALSLLYIFYSCSLPGD